MQHNNIKIATRRHLTHGLMLQAWATHSGPHRNLLVTNGLDLGGGRDNNFNGSQRCDNTTCTFNGSPGSTQPSQLPQPQTPSPLATANEPPSTAHNNYGSECNGSTCENKVAGVNMPPSQAAEGGSGPSATHSCNATSGSPCVSSQGQGGTMVQSNGTVAQQAAPGSPLPFGKSFPYGQEGSVPPTASVSGDKTFSSTMSCTGTSSCISTGANGTVTQNNG